MTTYAFDKDGTLDDNIIYGELQNPNPQNIDDPTLEIRYNYIVPRFAPFYAHDLKLKSAKTGQPLKENIDYWLTHRFDEAVIGTQRFVYGSITFRDRGYNDPVIIESYRTLGGEWTLDEAGIVAILAKNLLDPRKTPWSNITDLPNEFPVIEHDHDANDLTGMKNVEDAILACADAITNKGNDDDPTVDPLIEYGAARQYTLPANYDLGKRWMSVAILDLSSEGPEVTSDLNLIITGVEPTNTKQSSQLFVTMGHEITMVDTDNDPNTPDEMVVDATLHVSNLTQFVTNARLGWRHAVEPSNNHNQLELWLEVEDEVGAITVTDLSRGDGRIYSSAINLTEPVGIQWGDIYQLGNTPAADSLRLGGLDADQYVRVDTMNQMMIAITDQLHALVDGNGTPIDMGPERFVSLNHWTMAINDLIASVDALVSYVETGSGDIPDEVSVPDPFVDAPTGEPRFFVYRYEVMAALNTVKNVMDQHIENLITKGLVLNRQDLLARIQQPLVRDIPFPSGSRETSTQKLAITYLANEEMEAIMTEIVYVVNTMINSASNP
jgi:hypothetical protein